MGIYIDAATAKLFAANAARRSVFFRLALDPPLLLWSGAGEIEAPMRDVSVGDETYRGAKFGLGALPDLGDILNGGSDTAEFILSGIDAQTASLIDDAGPDVRGVSLHIGLLAFDADWQPATPIIPIGVCIGDFTTLRQDPPQSRADAPVWSVSLSCHIGDVTDRTRPLLTYWTPNHQSFIDPDDTSCDNVAKYQQAYDVKWPIL